MVSPFSERRRAFYLPIFCFCGLAGDSLPFDATALHGIEAIHEQPVAYLSVVFMLRDRVVAAGFRGRQTKETRHR